MVHPRHRIPLYSRSEIPVNPLFSKDDCRRGFGMGCLPWLRGQAAQANTREAFDRREAGEGLTAIAMTYGVSQTTIGCHQRGDAPSIRKGSRTPHRGAANESGS